MTSTSDLSKFSQVVPLRHSSPEELQKISRDGLLSLTLPEMRVIQDHFLSLQRDPTDVESETIAQTWSEHCYHKTFRAAFTYSEEKLNGERSLAASGPRAFSNLLKETIVKATNELSPPWCLSVFKDNAGVIAFDDEDAVCFKVETHNHPSALEPYGGAGTGIGGVIRDVLGCGLGAKPVMNTDVFCFGDLNTPADKLPQGMLPPKRIARGVISGVRDYGNRMGIPTANGAVYFDPGYTGNPLVFCGTVGLMPRSAITKEVQPGDLVVAMGGRTGRDGIHGATFSSAPLESGITSSVVQIGHAIMEKKTMDVLLQARNKGLYRSVTDCGAGGFSSAVGELGSTTGVRVTLDTAPLKYPGLKPWEIWVSESQERMVLAVPPQHWASLKTLCQQEDVEAVVIGEFTADKKLTITYQGETVGELDMHFLHDGLPQLKLDAVWNGEDHRKRHSDFVIASSSVANGNGTAKRSHEIATTAPIASGDRGGLAMTDISSTLKTLLSHPIIASKQSITRQYDHEVQGGSVIKPFMGLTQDAPTDACVFRPKLSSWKGVAVSNGLCPEIGKWDPYIMAKTAVDEAYRNLISVGGGLEHAAILDNFCWGDSKNPSELAGLVRAAEGCREAAMAYGLPFISGKDSFNNTWKDIDGRLHSIPPTLLVSSIGVLEDVRECLPSWVKSVGQLVYLVGETRGETKGSLATRLRGDERGALPDFDLSQTKSLYKKLHGAMKHRLVSGCHDLSEGGLAVAAAEMTFGGAVGLELQIPTPGLDAATFLFSETPGRLLVAVHPEHKQAFEMALGLLFVTQIGQVVKKPELMFKQGEQILFRDSVKNLKEKWLAPLAAL